MQFTNIFLRGDIMFSFRDYLCIQKLLRNFLCESELANNEFDYYELPITYGEWDEYFEYEKYEDSYTTPNGETVVAFGYYGMDM